MKLRQFFGAAKRVAQRLWHSVTLPHTLLNAMFVLYVWSLVRNGRRFIGYEHARFGHNGWGMSDFLINYQGGFVRRGLFGEVLLFFAQRYSFHRGSFIWWTCMVCFIATCLFFLVAFLRRRYSLYILPLCFFLGMGVLGNAVIRKDYFMMCGFIPVMWVYARQSVPTVLKYALVNVLLVCTILTHEAIAFFGLPILLLLVFRHHRKSEVLASAVMAALALAPSLVAFAATLKYHGSREITHAIWDAWLPLIAHESPYSLPVGDTVKSLAWSTAFAVPRHLRFNFFVIDGNISSLVVWMFTFPAIYYIASHFLYAFRKSDEQFTYRHKTVLSAVVLLQWLCLVPMFLVLSNDYIRVCFYWVASSYAIFLLVPLDTLEAAFPRFYIAVVESVNRVFVRVLIPTKATLALMILFIGVSPWTFNIGSYYSTTVIYQALQQLTEWLKPLIENVPLPQLSPL